MTDLSWSMLQTVKKLVPIKAVQKVLKPERDSVLQ